MKFKRYLLIPLVLLLSLNFTGCIGVNQNFKKIRHHLMALFPLEERAIKRLGADETQEILDDIRAAIGKLRAQGRSG